MKRLDTHYKKKLHRESIYCEELQYKLSFLPSNYKIVSLECLCPDALYSDSIGCVYESLNYPLINHINLNYPIHTIPWQTQQKWIQEIFPATIKVDEFIQSDIIMIVILINVMICC